MIDWYLLSWAVVILICGVFAWLGKPAASQRHLEWIAKLWGAEVTTIGRVIAVVFWLMACVLCLGAIGFFEIPSK